METERTLRDITDQDARIREMQEYLPQLIKQARLAGASWTDIGVALGITRQAAFKRWSYIDRQIGFRDVIFSDL